jgi:hypothetical protein
MKKPMIGWVFCLWVIGPFQIDSGGSSSEDELVVSAKLARVQCGTCARQFTDNGFIPSRLGGSLNQTFPLQFQLNDTMNSGKAVSVSYRRWFSFKFPSPSLLGSDCSNNSSKLSFTVAQEFWRMEYTNLRFQLPKQQVACLTTPFTSVTSVGMYRFLAVFTSCEFDFTRRAV